METGSGLNSWACSESRAIVSDFSRMGSSSINSNNNTKYNNKIEQIVIKILVCNIKIIVCKIIVINLVTYHNIVRCYHNKVIKIGIIIHVITIIFIII